MEKWKIKAKGLPSGKNVEMWKELKHYVVFCTGDDGVTLWWAETNDFSVANFIYGFED